MKPASSKGAYAAQARRRPDSNAVRELHVRYAAILLQFAQDLAVESIEAWRHASLRGVRCEFNAIWGQGETLLRSGGVVIPISSASGLRGLHGWFETIDLCAAPFGGRGAPPGFVAQEIIMAVTTLAKVVIIGSGPAGYTAAIYAARAMLAPILIQGVQPGGQMTITTDVENYPGFADVIQGPWLMEQMQKQAEHVGTRMVADHVTKVDFTWRPFRLECDSGEHFLAESVIVATGAQARWLELPSEQKFKGYGVSACATCDGFFYRGKDVLVVGGGNTAVEEALFLTNFASTVTLVHRRERLRAEKILQDRLFRNPKVSVIWNAALADVLGTDSPPKVKAVVLRDVNTNARSERRIDGVFIAIGHTPASAPFQGQLEMKASGYIKTAPFSTATSVPGVFAAGDVTDDIFRQAVTAAGQGCMAALEAERFLAARGEAEPAVAAE
jgi:thioredoxin reductase (NADPH)